MFTHSIEITKNAYIIRSLHSFHKALSFANLILFHFKSPHSIMYIFHRFLHFLHRSSRSNNIKQRSNLLHFLTRHSQAERRGSSRPIFLCVDLLLPRNLNRADFSMIAKLIPTTSAPDSAFFIHQRDLKDSKKARETLRSWKQSKTQSRFHHRSGTSWQQSTVLRALSRGASKTKRGQSSRLRRKMTGLANEDAPDRCKHWLLCAWFFQR